MALTKVTGQVIKNTTDVTVGVLTVTNTLAVGGTVSIGGTLTYEDVTNVDAVGLITARNGIVVGSGITLSKDGDIFATGISTFVDGVKVGSGITLSKDGDIFATGISTFVDGVKVVGGDGNVTVITSINDVGIVSSTNSAANFLIFDNDTENKIRTVDGRLHISADVRDAVADSEIRFLVDNNIQAQVSAGSSFILANDSDTFLGHPAGNTLTVTTAGSEAVRINSTGKILVNHTASVGSGQIQSFTDNSDAIDITAYSTTAANGGRLTFYRSKNATIGSNTEVAASDSLGRIDWRGYNDDGTAFNIGATVEAIVNGDVDSTSDMPSALLFKTSADGAASPTERLRITSDGDVSIGGVTPARGPLHVHEPSSNDCQIHLTNNDTGSTSQDGLTIFTDTDTSGIWSRENVDFQIATNGTERLRITSGGQLLGIDGTEAAPTYSFIGNTDAGIYSDTDNNVFMAIDGTVRMRFNISHFSPGVDDAYDLGNNSYRWDDVRATNGSIATSDRNEKNTITATDLGLDFVNKLSPVSYKFNSGTRTHYGLIAQDIETVLTDIGKSTANFAGFIKDSVDDDGNSFDPARYGLRYQEFISPMIKAIQELSAENTALKARVAALESS